MNDNNKEKSGIKKVKGYSGGEAKHTPQNSYTKQELSEKIKKNIIKSKRKKK